jgi:hypothetical protein
MNRDNPKEIALELVIAGIVGALAKSGAVKPAVLEDWIAVPLYTRFRSYQGYAERVDSEEDARFMSQCAAECAKWHSLLSSVIDGLKK